MTTALANRALIAAALALLGITLMADGVWSQTSDATSSAERTGKRPITRWSKLSVDFPTSVALFPSGEGAEIANGQCLICHSAGMVLRQPPLAKDEWLSEINKMRNSFGAPLPADQVDALARYLERIGSGSSARDDSVLEEPAK